MFELLVEKCAGKRSAETSRQTNHYNVCEILVKKLAGKTFCRKVVPKVPITSSSNPLSTLACLSRPCLLAHKVEQLLFFFSVFSLVSSLLSPSFSFSLSFSFLFLSFFSLAFSLCSLLFFFVLFLSRALRREVLKWAVGALHSTHALHTLLFAWPWPWPCRRPCAHSGDSGLTFGRVMRPCARRRCVCCVCVCV